MFETIKMKTEEVLYAYRNSHEISMKTGLIGYVRADMGKSGKEFWSTWWPFREDLNTPEFKEVLNDVINSLRADGKFLCGRSMLERFCNSDKVLRLYPDTEYYGVRVDTEKYAFLMRLCPLKGDYNLYCYGYVKEWLDKHIENAKHGISFRDANCDYKELFRLYDGDQIMILYGEDTVDKDTPRYSVRYINDTHFESETNIYHIDQFADMIALHEGTVIPLRASLPERCYVFIDTDQYIGIVVKGEKGFYRTEITAPTRDERKALVDELNEKLGVTKAQAQAMKAGSMFGWHCPGADPKNYDSDGHLIRKSFKV